MTGHNENPPRTIEKEVFAAPEIDLVLTLATKMGVELTARDILLEDHRQPSMVSPSPDKFPKFGPPYLMAVIQGRIPDMSRDGFTTITRGIDAILRLSRTSVEPDHLRGIAEINRAIGIRQGLEQAQKGQGPKPL